MVTSLETIAGRARFRIEEKWHKALDAADETDDEGGHVGISSYYRNVARGLGEALQIIDEEVMRAKAAR